VKRATLSVVTGFLVSVSLPTRAEEPTKQQCVSSSEQGQDLRRTGKLTAARAQFAACLATSCPGPVREDCAQRIAEVDAAMPAIVFEAKDESGNDLAQVRVSVDGRPLVERLDGTALPLDPGEHHFVFAAQGKQELERTYVLRERDKARRERIVLATATPANASMAGGSGPAVSPNATEVAPTGNEPPPSSRRLSPLFFVAGGVAVVGLGVGIGAGVASTSSHSSLVNNCKGNDCPPSEQSDLDAFHSMRTVSTIGYVIGGAGLIGAAVLFFTAPREAPATGAAIWLGPGVGGLRGTF
jgi:hypothetical protein